jgi:hypothetical protein
MLLNSELSRGFAVNWQFIADILIAARAAILSFVGKKGCTPQA